jgi:hypothetical protein
LKSGNWSNNSGVKTSTAKAQYGAYSTNTAYISTAAEPAARVSKSNRTRQNNRPAAHGGKQKGTPPCIAFSPILHIFIWGIIFNSEAMLDIIIVLAGFYLFCGIVRVLLGGFGKSDYQRDR